VIRLKFERVNRRISQETLALATKLPQPIISLIEIGTWNPTPDQLAALGRALGIAPPELLLQEVVLPTAGTRPTEQRQGVGR
jgi:transcriptional regulator with XRE-family HTH domain